MIKWWANVGRNPSRQLSSWPSLVAISAVLVEISVISYDFLDRTPSKVNYHIAKFGGHKHCGSGDIIILVT